MYLTRTSIRLKSSTKASKETSHRQDGYAKADTTTNEYMQAIPESVQGDGRFDVPKLEKGGDEKNDSDDLQTKCNKATK
jgi:hypothetical protein